MRAGRLALASRVVRIDRERSGDGTIKLFEGTAGRLRRAGAELAVLGVIGLLLGALGPYGTAMQQPVLRYSYWLVAIVGGGLIGIAIDQLVGRYIAATWPRVLLVALMMTPIVTLYILWANRAMLHEYDVFQHVVWQLGWQVFAISLLVMVVRALVWRRADPIVETRIVVEFPLPEHEAKFRRRLSARRRTARLIALEAHDHYLRVHTDAGSELITMRFVDAMAELERAHGYRLHRSWWVFADAIQSVRWHRGGGTARLGEGLEAPVSRSNVQRLKEAGWP